LVKITTGFPSVMMMMGFIIILNNGNIQDIRQTVTTLTWLEEYLVYFETVWGKNSFRWCDLEIRFKISSKTLRTIFDNKLAKHMMCVLWWPKFTSFTEDITLRKVKWDMYYMNRRVVMWDNTNIPICFKPSAADTQRNTYSAYYAGNVAKGGVFIQPCGWMGTHDLWVGATTDSDYLSRSGVLKIHKSFVSKCETNSDVPFTILLDKGYRVTTITWRTGGQFILQPTFSRNESKFTAHQSIRSAAVAADRAANERAVQ
jgi:DDE superfamily endonuclease